LSQTVSFETSSRALVSGDAGAIVVSNSASSMTFTVNTSTALSVGQSISIVRYGAGALNVAASGVTVNATPGLNFRAQHSAATLVCLSSGVYALIGDLSA
jgi:hypothetical protein